jgi:hypothetical protein
MPLRSLQHQGREWTVWDTRPAAPTLGGGQAAVAEGYTSGWLTFQCDTEKRRLAPPPELWDRLSDPELVALLERAAPVRRAPDMRF